MHVVYNIIYLTYGIYRYINTDMHIMTLCHYYTLYYILSTGIIHTHFTRSIKENSNRDIYFFQHRFFYSKT